MKIVRRSCVPLIAAVVFVSSGLVSSPTQAADDTLAPNDFGNNETDVPAALYQLGAKQRQAKEYEKENPDKDLRAYYEHGAKGFNTDGECRAKVAYRAARYAGPANGYETAGTSFMRKNLRTKEIETRADGPRPKAGGEKPPSAIPADAATMINNVYKFVEDITYPKFDPSTLDPDATICSKIEFGTIDIGKPDSVDEYMCIETNLFFTSLVRELGFPAREANVLPAKEGRYYIQTAASLVWYDGAWHFFDPWESFTDTKQYLTSHGHAAGYVENGKFDNVDLFVSLKPPTGFEKYKINLKTGMPDDASQWKKVLHHTKNATGITVDTFALRMRVQDELRRDTGWYQGGQLAQIPGARYLPHDEEIFDTKASTSSSGMYGVEGVALGYADDEPPATHGYTATIENPTGSPQSFAVRVETQLATVALSASPATVAGKLAPGEARTLDFTVTIGDRLDLPPDVVDDAHVDINKNAQQVMSWSAVPGASDYRLYVSKHSFTDPGEKGVKLLGTVKSTSLLLHVKKSSIIGVQAVGANGLAAGLDPEGGSTAFAPRAKHRT